MAKWFLNMDLRWNKLRDKATPLGKLFRADKTCFRKWITHIPSIDKYVGEETRRRATDILVLIAQEDPLVARKIVVVLPEELAKLTAVNRHTVLSICEWVAREEPKFIPLLLRYIVPLIHRYNEDQLISYISKSMGLFLESSHKAEALLKGESLSAQRVLKELEDIFYLEEISKNMTYYARAHCGEDIQIRSGRDRAFSDGKHIYLPEKIELEDDLARLVYRVLTARNAGYIEFGTLQLDLSSISGEWLHPREDELELERMLRSFANSSLAKDIFMIYENYRVEHCIRREYPGVAQVMDELGQQWRLPQKERNNMSRVEQAVDALQRSVQGKTNTIELDSEVHKTVEKSIANLTLLLLPEATVESSVLALQTVFDAFYSLLSVEREKSNSMLQQNPVERGATAGSPSDGEYRPLPSDIQQGELNMQAMSEKDRQQEQRARALKEELQRKGKEISLQQAREKTRMDFAEVSDFLERMPGPSGPRREDGKIPAQQEASTIEQLTGDMDILPNTWLYPEWDVNIEDIKPDWTQVREFRLRPSNLHFSNTVMTEYSSQIARIRKIFEALRPEELSRHRGVEDGEELDFDRVIGARVLQKSGGIPSAKVYTQKIRKNRDTMVALLLDMSSSTNELANVDGKRILDVEKEALVVISEALEAIGDRFSIYGFSGYGRDQVAFYIAKELEDSWGDSARARIGQMSWKMENRDGAAIRHCIEKMKYWPAKNKVLMLLSDGKPLDCGCSQYSDEYAQQDTKMALREARNAGIKPFCITVDPYGQDYLQHMYGANRYIVIDRVETLPRTISKIYRKLAF